jgi:hypothetical protein
VIAPAFKFGQQIGVFIGTSWAAELDATEVVGGTMLADVLITGAIKSVIVSRQFGEESEYDALFVLAEDDDSGHWLTLSRERTVVA